MYESLIPLPKKDVNKFFHPESQELILTAAAVTTAFTFWNAVNIRPSILTDPGYSNQYEGIRHHMNLSLAVIVGLSATFALIYGVKGLLPSIAAASTGVVMYAWTNAELNKHSEDGLLSITDINAESVGLKIHTENYPVMYRPMYMPKNRREAAMFD
jgi:hypothetical protein